MPASSISCHYLALSVFAHSTAAVRVQILDHAHPDSEESKILSGASPTRLWVQQYTVVCNRTTAQAALGGSIIVMFPVQRQTEQLPILTVAVPL